MADDDGMPGEQLEEPGFPAGDQADHGVEGVFDFGVGESVDAAGPTAAGPTADESERHESVGDADVRAPGRAAAEGAGGGVTPAGAVDSDWPARHGEGSQAADQVALVGDSQDVTAAAETSVGRGLEPGDSDMAASGSGVVAETMTGEIESVDGNRPAAPETAAAEARFDEGHQGEVDTDGPPSPSAGSSPDVVAAAAVSRPEPALAAGVPAGSSAGVGEESAGVGEESAGVGEESAGVGEELTAGVAGAAGSSADGSRRLAAGVAEESAGADGSTESSATTGRSSRLEQLERQGEVAADFLERLLDIADLDGDIDVDVDGDRAAVAVVDSDEGRVPRRLVGPDGRVLEALQELTRLAVQAATGERSRLMLDVAGFRAERRSALVHMARAAIAEVKESGRQKSLADMTAFERKVVHDEVTAAGLVSESEGVEPNRHIVILPA